MAAKQIDVIWARFVSFFKRMRKLFKANTIPENLESTKAQQTSVLELDKIRRDASVLVEKISRRI